MILKTITFTKNMITVQYQGKTGNNIFQYCFARVLSEKLNLNVIASPIPGLCIDNIIHDKQSYNNEEITLLDGHLVDIESLVRSKTKRVHLNGYFQRAEYYEKYRDTIKNNWILKNPHLLKASEQCLSIDEEDLAIHIRLTDYHTHGYVINVDHYKRMIDQLSFKRLFIFTDNHNDPFIHKFRDYQPFLVSSENPMLDWHTLTRFNKIIGSQSSYSWWAAFLSDAKEIVFPITQNTGVWANNRGDINLIPNLSSFRGVE
jgi:hypothetical protein